MGASEEGTADRVSQHSLTKNECLSFLHTHNPLSWFHCALCDRLDFLIMVVVVVQLYEKITVTNRTQ